MLVLSLSASPSPRLLAFTSEVVAQRPTGIGFNLGHSHSKVVVLEEGHEPLVIMFPSFVAPAMPQPTTDLIQLPTIELGGARYWVGETARETALPEFTQARITDPHYLALLTREALRCMGPDPDVVAGLLTHARCVTGLPATWSLNSALCKTLVERLRWGMTPVATGPIKVLAESVGLAYFLALDDAGHITDDRYLQGSIGVVDFGGGTVDSAVLTGLRSERTSLLTLQMGAAKPLTVLQQQLGGSHEVDVPLYAVEAAIRTGRLQYGSVDVPLPDGWDVPFRVVGAQVAAALERAWGRGKQFTTIAIGGGGALLPALVEPVLAKFPGAVVVPNPQAAIAWGYARYGRFLLNQTVRVDR